MLFLYCNSGGAVHFWQRCREFFFSKGKGAPIPTPYIKRSLFPKVLGANAGRGNLSQDLSKFFFSFSDFFFNCLTTEAGTVPTSLTVRSCQSPRQGKPLYMRGLMPRRHRALQRKTSKGWAWVLSACRQPSLLGLTAELLCPNISKQAEIVWAAGSSSTSHP